MLLRTFILFCLVTTQVCAQQKFHKIFGTMAPETGHSGKQVYDNGFVAVGNSGGGTNGNSDIILVRTDIDGNLRWQKSIGFNQADQGYSVEMAADSGFLIAGYTNSLGAGGYDVLLIKTDTAGNKLWHKTYGGTDWDLGYRLINDANGGYTIVGQSFSGGAGNGDGYLVHTDASGNLLWQKYFGGTEEDGFQSIRQLADGGYVMCGYSHSFSSAGGKELYVVRTNSSGTKIWETTVGDTLGFYGKDIEENSFGEFVIVGAGKVSPDSSDEDVLVVRLSGAGVFMNKYFFSGDIGGNDILNSICKMNSSLFFSVGHTSFDGDDVWLLALDQTGYVYGNSKTCGDVNIPGLGAKDEANFTVRTNDNRFLVVGTTDGYMNPVNRNMFVAAFDSLGETVAYPQVYVGVEERVSSSKFVVRNNGYGTVMVDIPADFKMVDMNLYNVNGQLVTCKTYRAGSSLSVDFSGNAPGVYLLNLIGEDETVTMKLINQE